MSMLGMVQNFISQVSGAVNGKDNPLGLSVGQIDEINQINILYIEIWFLHLPFDISIYLIYKFIYNLYILFLL